jgi:D-3-phosphoglycerate dehydrogenase
MNRSVEKQFSDSKGDIAYLLVDVTGVNEADMKSLYQGISATRANVATRMLISM